MRAQFPVADIPSWKFVLNGLCEHMIRPMVGDCLDIDETSRHPLLVLHLKVTIRNDSVGFWFCRLDDVETTLPSLQCFHSGAGFRETRLPTPSLPVISGDDHVAVRLLTHRQSTLTNLAWYTRSVPVQLDVHDTDATNQGCDIRRTPNLSYHVVSSICSPL